VSFSYLGRFGNELACDQAFSYDEDMKKLVVVLQAAFIAFSVSCGNGAAPVNPTWTPNVYKSYSLYANYCENPRSGTDPETGHAFLDRAGSTTLENFWIRSWINATYLWYSEVTDRNPASYSSTDDYFAVMKTNATTPSGHPKDHFHFTLPTDQWFALSESGTPVSYGIGWAIVTASPPRNVLVAYSQPNAPISLPRGAKILSIDGIDMINGSNVDALNAALFPTDSNESHVFVINDTPSSGSHSVTLTASTLTEMPVQNVTVLSQQNGDKVGYILFNQQEAEAEEGLIDAINTLKSANVTDLVLDLRYNGGGFLTVASEAAYMIAGPTVTHGKIFEGEQYNDKIGMGTPERFQTTTAGFPSGPPAGTPLPYLGLSRVFVLTTSATCSASESIINGLRGIGVQVFQFGSTTCGKPYAFIPTDNCGTTYFAIQIKGVNDVGFGDYADGFTPANSGASFGVSLPGCAANDDFTHELGNAAESMLSAALQYRLNATCPALALKEENGVRDSKLSIRKPFYLTNRFKR